MTDKLDFQHLYGQGNRTLKSVLDYDSELYAFRRTPPRVPGRNASHGWTEGPFLRGQS